MSFPIAFKSKVRRSVVSLIFAVGSVFALVAVAVFTNTTRGVMFLTAGAETCGFWLRRNHVITLLSHLTNRAILVTRELCLTYR